MLLNKFKTYLTSDVNNSQMGIEDIKLLPALLNQQQFSKLLDGNFDYVDYNIKKDVIARNNSTNNVRILRVLRAASLGDVDQLKEYNDNEILEAKDSLGRGCLCYAAYYAQSNVISCLLHELHAPRNERDSDGRSVLEYACVGGDLNVLEMLIKSKCEVDNKNNIDENLIEIISNDNIEDDLYKGLILAARKGHIHIVKWLLNSSWGQNLLEYIQTGSGASLLHLIGQKLNANDLINLQECGLNLDLTSTSRRGVPVLQQIRPEVLEEFLNLSISCTIQDNDDVISEVYKINNPFIHNNTVDLDIKTLITLSESIVHKYLIFHPVFTGICNIKWQYVRKWYYSILIIFILFATVTSSLTLFFVQNAYFHENPEIINLQLKSFQSQTIMWQSIFTFLLFILLFFEIICNTRISRPVINIIRYMLWVICITLVIILLTQPVGVIQENSFFIFLVSWCLCTKHLGHHYLLSRYYSNFIEITKTFVKILCVFGSIMLALIFSLHVILLKNNTSPFRYIHTSLLKGITMMIGDMTIEEFQEHYTDIQWSVVFCIFTVVLTILLYNMTNALAVSDTHRLDSQADLYRVTSLARQILWCQTFVKRFVPYVHQFSIQTDHFQWIIANYIPYYFHYKKHIDMSKSLKQEISLHLPIDIEFIEQLKIIHHKNNIE